MLITITTKKEVIITTGESLDVCFVNGNLLIEGDTTLQIPREELLSLKFDDLQSREESYSFSKTNTSQWITSVSSLLTIKVKNKLLRSILTWLFPQQQTR